jgi:hypothetical protein
MADSTGFVAPNPVSAYTAAIAGAVQTGLNLYLEFKSLQVHPLASEWVGRVQDPFGAQLAVIVDAKDAALRAGTATADDVYYAQQAVEQLWTGYQQAAAQFAAQGPDQAHVIEKSYATLTPIINQILNDMSAQIAQLGGISTAARLGIGVNVSHYGILVVIAFLVVITIIVLRRI